MSTNKGLDFSKNKHYFEHYSTAVAVQDAKVYCSFTDKYGFPQVFDTNSKFNGFLHPSTKALIDFIATLVDPEATVDPIVRQIVAMLRTNFVALDSRYQHIPGKVYNGVVNITPLDFEKSNNPRVKEVGLMLKNFLFDHDVEDNLILQLMQVQQVTIKLKSEHVIVQDEVKGYDNPKSKSATIVANTEDKLARLAADREAR